MTKVRVPVGYIRHVVLFKFKSEVERSKIQEIEKDFGAMAENISAVEGFEWGRDVSVENRQKGFTHCFLVTFRDDAGRDAYLSHPEHLDFVDKLQPLLEDLLVIDYRAQT